MGYGESMYYNDAYGALDYYKRYRVRSYEAVAAAAAASAYNYAEQTMSHLPQVQNTAVTSHLNSTSADPYDRHLLPNSGAAATSALLWLLPLPPLPPITEGTGAPCVVVQLYSPQLERATVKGQRVSCLRPPAAARNSLYDMARYERSSMWTEHGTQPFKN